jgi:hypothetical protein
VRRIDLRGDAGLAAGAEVLALGLLTFAVGALLIANAWGVVDAKVAVTAAAREAARAFVEADDGAAAEAAALAAARATLTGHGRDADRLAPFELRGRFARCARVTAVVGYAVPAVALPWIGGLGDTVVLGRHTEVVDPYRSGLPADPADQEPDCAA